MALETELTITELTDGNTAQLDDFLALQTALFPQDVRYVPVMRKRASRPADADPRFIEHQWLIRHRDEPIAVTIFKYARMRDCGIGLDIGIKPAARPSDRGRSGRLSEWLTERCLDQLASDASACGRPTPVGLAVEVESEQLVRRFRQYGFIELPLEYHEPPFIQHQLELLAHETGTRTDFRRMHLGIFATGQAPLDPHDRELQRRIVLAFLVDHYGLAPDHWAVQRALGTDS